MNKGLIAMLSASVGTVTGAVVSGKISGKAIEQTKLLSNKHLELFLLMNQWVKVKQEGKNLSSYLEKKGYKRIAIYGMSYAGLTLYDELKGSDVKVAYGIDKNADSIYADIEVISMNESLKEVDAIIVTAISYFDEIEEELSQKINVPIISLEDIVFEV